MNNTYSAGDYIDAWCTKCQLELGHTIVAMVDNLPKRVKCNTCGGEHNYRGRPSEISRAISGKPARKARTRKTDYSEYLARLNSSSDAEAVKYNISGSFHKDDMIEHPRFGIGIVLSVINENKVEVLFKDGPKLLVQNR